MFAAQGLTVTLRPCRSKWQYSKCVFYSLVESDTVGITEQSVYTRRSSVWPRSPVSCCLLSTCTQWTQHQQLSTTQLSY